MPKRIASVVLALFYLSVSLCFSTGHVHDHSKGLPHQCAACAWHFESQSDVPTTLSFLDVPLLVVAPAMPLELRTGISTPLIRADRGPPLLS